MRGRAEPKNHIPTLYIFFSYLPLTIFHKCCLSGPYLGKYIMNCNETWFIDRWQNEEGQCTITIILFGILTKLSPLNHFFSIMVACPGHILESTKWIEIKLGTYIDVDKRKCKRQKP